MPTCKYCSYITSPLLGDDHLEPGTGTSKHHESISALIESSQHCQSCSFFLNQLVLDIDEIKEAAEFGSPSPVSIETIVHRHARGRSLLAEDSLDFRIKVSSEGLPLSGEAGKVWHSDWLEYCTNKYPYASRPIWSSQNVTSLPLTQRCSVIKKWIKQCEDTHAHCNSERDNDFQRPARIIDVKTSGIHTVKLVPGHIALADNAPYIALSHCWGDKQIPQSTTTKSVLEYYDSITTSSLPRTFQDAISIVQHLNVQYLWIDSLCIIQDDAADWEKESAKMADIFRNAYAIVAAAAGHDSSGGCGVKIKPTVCIRIPSAVDPHHRKVFIRRRMNQQLKHSPLNARAWVLQELVLARRILHFMNDQIFWQCHELVESENGIRTSYPPVDARNRSLAMAVSPEYVFATAHGCGEPNLWWRWVVNFSRRSLSRRSDRLPAMAGLTKLYEKDSSDRPVIGLWKKDLLVHLTWTTTALWREIKPYRHPGAIPSWTWASLEDCSFATPDFSNSRKIAPRSEIIGIDIEYSGQPLTSPLNHGKIFLRCKVEERKLTSGDELHPDTRPGRLYQRNEIKDTTVHIITLFVWHPIVPQNWSAETDIVSINYESLVVEATARGSEYRRVGLLQHRERPMTPEVALDSWDGYMKETWGKLQEDDFGDRIICLV
ncbi:HET-domain-containing protein [Tothia fuscella]|uniref:HET-domain-containing protein n=1 Tax=Tothia fuscella TaxID=1048955 RepID=A0A9P4U3W4_9PEZI|nr:HET-domain-containing protein [Tothia fuscella]